ncbi:hypothetical protein DL768_000069 [Monosporascus sp. mg162]|nr:hypothetical protein DL768_000069 [Monosporascus sp. mg162]
MDGKLSLYDSPLLNNFSRLSRQEGADLRGVFDDILMQRKPVKAVTVVQKHDAQKGQTVEALIEDFFKVSGHSRRFYYGLRAIPAFSTATSTAPGASTPSLLPMEANWQISLEPVAFTAMVIRATTLTASTASVPGNKDFELTETLGLVRRGTHDRLDGLAYIVSNTGPGEI